MKKLIVSLFFACIFITHVEAAVSQPKPVEGAAGIIAKSFTSQAGDFIFKIKFPSGWGMGDMQASPDGSGNFLLLPVNRGYGCRIEIIPFENGTLAQEMLENLKLSFKSINDVKGGFEAELPKAWFAAKVEERQLIQIWYSLPKKTKESAAIWPALRDCVSISSTNVDPGPSDKYEPVTQNTNGWVCHHPSNKLRVLFETFPIITCSKAKEASEKYQLAFHDFKSSGYFYVKWDQTDLKTKNSFQNHLKEMLQDIKNREATQKMSADPAFNLESGYATWGGQPYDLYTIAGDEFLFGFAVKSNNSFMPYDINDLIKKVKWIKKN